MNPQPQVRYLGVRQPILNRQTWDSIKLSRIGGHQYLIQRSCVCSDQKVVRSDQLTLSSQEVANFCVVLVHTTFNREDINCRQQQRHSVPQYLGFGFLSTIPQFGGNYDAGANQRFSYVGDLFGDRSLRSTKEI